MTQTTPDVHRAAVDDMAPMPEKFAPEEYPWLTVDGGAAKLASSQVAPLVALARGNETIASNATDAQLRDATARLHLPDRRNRQGKRFREELRAGDVLVMPWFSVTSLDEGRADVPAAIQYRPSVPVTDLEGREAKYEFVLGQGVPVGVHPSTPAGWLRETARPVLIAEGQLKADSALTGVLRHLGVDRDDLLTAEGETAEEARARLAAILKSAAPKSCPLIVEIAGVHSWMSAKLDLSKIKLARRACWLGIDGDVAEKPAVWQAAHSLWEWVETRDATAMLLSPTAVRGSDTAKVGIDDFLADHGCWRDLLGMISAVMPAQPAEVDDLSQVDSVRCNNQMTRIERCEAVRDSSGTITGVVWKPTGIDIAGRIKSISTARIPLPEEMTTGVFDVEAQDRTDRGYTQRTELEVGWLDQTSGEMRTAVISGPTATLLSQLPEKWGADVSVPSAVMKLDCWPPRRDDGIDFMRAVKKFRVQDTVESTRWMRNGWVPVPDHPVPAFVIGDQKICDPEEAEYVVSDVTAQSLPHADDFGVGEKVETATFESKAYRRALARDIERLIEVFLRSDAFTNPGVAVLAVAAGLRGALPLSTRTTLSIRGRSGGGKSFTASKIMSFWSRRRHSWMSGQLPGAASDSVASINNARQRSVMWVIDDLAPARGGNKSNADIDKVSDAIRNQFNGSTPGRTNRDGTARPTNPPHGLLVITTENELATQSIRQRCIEIRMPKGSLGDGVEDLISLCDVELVPARVTQGLIKFLREVWCDRCGGWAEMMAEMTARYERARDLRIASWLKRGLSDRGACQRAGEMLSDLYLSLDYLSLVMRELDMDEDLIAELGNQAKRDADKMVAEGLDEQEDSSATASLVDLIRQVLSTGLGYIESVPDPTALPGDDKAMAARLGWASTGRAGEMRPMGARIGRYLIDPKDDEPYVLLDPGATWKVVYSNFRDEMGGSGISKSSVWNAFYEDGLNHPAFRRVRRGDRYLPCSQVRIARGAQADRYSGVPVTFEVLLDGRRQSEPESD